MIALQPVDRVEVLSVMNNTIDVLMGSSPVARRPKRSRDVLAKSQLRAEHGVSMLVTHTKAAKRIFSCSIPV